MPDEEGRDTQCVVGTLWLNQSVFSHLPGEPLTCAMAGQVEKTTTVIISGFDKSAVGQFAATVRSKRPPEPYKQKGVRYVDEVVPKKEGKRGK